MIRLPLSTYYYYYYYYYDRNIYALVYSHGLNNSMFDEEYIFGLIVKSLIIQISQKKII